MARHICKACSRPISVCLCSAISRQTNLIPVIVLQHPDEQNKALGTAKLIALGLSRAHIYCGEEFSEEDILNTFDQEGVRHPVLVYPRHLDQSKTHYVLDFETDRFNSVGLNKQADAIILLDGTWRNTRELLIRNPWLSCFPTLEIKNAPVSQYRIRKASQDGALATIEAVSLILEKLDQGFDSTRFLSPFKIMIDLQIEKMGSETFCRNYSQLI